MKHLKYLRYMLIHKWWVLIAGLHTKAPLYRLLIHDWSKFLPCEWLPYTEFFYGWTSKNRAKAEAKPAMMEFHHAWLHHLHTNPHHWQHWILHNDDGTVKALEMPEDYVREMVADWAGAGRAITGKWDLEAWFEKNSYKMHMHINTQGLVQQLIRELRVYTKCPIYR